jgi:hypothetical protein
MDSPFGQAQRFATSWMDCASRMAQTGMAFDTSRAPPELARQMRTMVFAAMAQYAEQFMRSPEFLEGMKRSLDAAITFRKQMNGVLTAMQHNAQGVARQDIDSLMLTMRHIETRVLDAITEVSGRLDDLTRRLDGLENPPAEPAGDTPAATAPVG